MLKIQFGNQATGQPYCYTHACPCHSQLQPPTWTQLGVCKLFLANNWVNWSGLSRS